MVKESYIKANAQPQSNLSSTILVTWRLEFLCFSYNFHFSVPVLMLCLMFQHLGDTTSTLKDIVSGNHAFSKVIKINRG